MAVDRGGGIGEGTSRAAKQPGDLPRTRRRPALHRASCPQARAGLAGHSGPGALRRQGRMAEHTASLTQHGCAHRIPCRLLLLHQPHQAPRHRLRQRAALAVGRGPGPVRRRARRRLVRCGPQRRQLLPALLGCSDSVVGGLPPQAVALLLQLLGAVADLLLLARPRLLHLLPRSRNQLCHLCRCRGARLERHLPLLLHLPRAECHSCAAVPAAAHLPHHQRARHDGQQQVYGQEQPHAGHAATAARRAGATIIGGGTAEEARLGRQAVKHGGCAGGMGRGTHAGGGSAAGVNGLPAACNRGRRPGGTSGGCECSPSRANERSPLASTPSSGGQQAGSGPVGAPCKAGAVRSFGGLGSLNFNVVVPQVVQWRCQALAMADTLLGWEAGWHAN